MAELTHSVSIDRSPDDVWKVVADFGAISDWFPGMTSSQLEGDDRIMELDGGIRLVERRISSDDDTRTLTYELVESPLPVESYRASMTVEAEGDGSKVVWHQVFEPADLAAVFEGLGPPTLEQMKTHLEG